MSKYIFTKIEDEPTLTSEYIGMLNNGTSHTHKHTFNLGKEAEGKLLDIVMKYGITRDDFTEKDKKEHEFFYEEILHNKKRFGNNLVYYYYSKELEELDKYNLPLDREMYKNGILVYGAYDMISINNAYRLTEKINKTDEEKGYSIERIEEFKQFFLSKRKGHDFKKDVEDIINAEDNAVEYQARSMNKYYSKKYHRPIERDIRVDVKSPRMEFILNQTNLSNESKTKFMKYTDLRDFVLKYSEIYKSDKTFNLDELKEFFKAVDKIDSEYMLHYELMDQTEDLKEKLGI